MNTFPVLETDRLILRQFEISDSSRVQELAGVPEVAATALNIPHPYEDGMAEKWISTHSSLFSDGKGVVLAISLKAENLLTGAVGLVTTPKHKRAELGYWMGLPYWGNGYCTEAATAIIQYGFDVLEYHKVTASHMESNPASGRVMEKAGMLKEGMLRDEIFKDGQFHTSVVYGIINSVKDTDK